MNKSRIMVVEDSGIVLLDIQQSLNSLGYEVVATASTKDDAILKTQETRPDLVLMDIRLGEDMGGIEAADYIREHFNIPVVFLTGYADEDTFQRAKITDPFGYILKPFDPKGLRTTIEIALHNHKLKSELRNSEKRYRTLVETMNDGVGQADADGKLTFVNSELCQMTGYSKKELIGREHLILFPVEREELQMEEFEKRKAGESNSFETLLARKDGSTIPVILSGSPVFSDDGEFSGIIGVFTDISDRAKAEEDVRKSRQALVDAERQVHMGHFEIDVITGESVWSEETFNILGFDPDSGEPDLEAYHELFHPDDVAKIIELYKKSVQQDSSFDIVHRIVRSDGEIRYVHSNARILTNGNGSARKLFGTVQDVTELKRVELALKESEERYRMLFENSPIAIWEENFSAVQKSFNDLRKSGISDFRDYFENNPDEVTRLIEMIKITSINETSVNFFDASSKDEISINLRRYFADGAKDVFREELIALADGAKRFASEIPVRDLSGQYQTLFLDLAVAPAYEQTLERVLVSYMDITERKQAEEVMLARYRLVRQSLTLSLPDLLQATLDEIEMLTRSSISFFHFVDEDQVHLSLQAWSTNTLQNMCKADGDGLHYPIGDAGVWVDCVRERGPVIHNDYHALKHRKGFPEGHAEVRREMVIPIIRGEDIVAIVGVGNKDADYIRKDVEIVALLADLAWDVVERKQTEAALQESESLYHDLVETAQDLIWQCDQDGRYVYLNPAWEDVFGYRVEDMLRRPFTDFQAPDTATRDQDMFEKLLGGDSVKGFETVHLGKGGREIHLVFNAKSIYDEQGNVVGTRGTAYDITNRKRAEDALVKSEYLLRESQKIAHMGHYILDISSGVWESSDSLNKLFGIDWNYRADVDGWLNIVHPDERENMAVYFAEEIVAKRQNFDREYRIVRVNDGEVRWVHGLGRLEFDETNTPIRMIGNIQDITERKQAEITVRESAARYRAVVENQTEFIVRWKPDGTRTFVNEAYLRYYDLTLEQALKTDFLSSQVVEADRHIVEEKIARLMSGEINTETDIHRVIKPDGSIGWQEWTDHAIYDDQGNIVEIQSVGRDITERVLAEESLRTKTTELESLFSISAHLRTAQSADDMLPVVLDEMRRVLRSDANAIISFNADEGHFTYAISDGPLVVNDGVQFNVENSISGLILQTRQPYTTENFFSDPNRAASLHGEDGLGPAVFAPVMSDSEFLGVLLCARNKGTEAQPYAESDVQLLTAIGEMVGNALRRARLYDQALTRLQNVQTLHSIDMAISANLDLSVILDVLLAQGMAQLDVDAASILLLNPHTHMLEFAAGNGFRSKEIDSVHLRLGEGLPGQAAMDRKILYIPDLSITDNLLRKHLLEESFVSYQAAPLIAKGQLQGVLEVFYRRPIVVGDEQTGFLETLATQAAIAIDNSQLFSDLQRSNFELEMAYDATIEGWSRALELRDQETEGHTLRVTDITLRLAQAMGVMSGELIHIRRGALLHDIGKVGIPDRILLKPGELVGDEWELMKKHTVYAFEMLRPIEFLRPAIDIPYCHHERWDGTGYPRQLKGEQIPLSARLFAVADVWDALTNDRPYRKAWTEEKALDYITSNVGKHFDPRVVEKFLELLNENHSL